MPNKALEELNNLPKPQAGEELALLNQSINSHMRPKDRSDDAGEPIPGDPFGGFKGGIITGPLMEFFGRGNAREEAAAQSQILEGERGADELTAAGIDTSSLGDDRLGALTRQLADPNTRAAGMAELDQIQAAQGVNTPMQQLTMAGEAQNRLMLEGAKAVASEERSMRASWQTMIAPTVNVLRSVDMARGQLELGSPEAALNSARIFIQQLDSSMVTNPEIANVIQQQGLAGQLAQFENWAKGGGSFDDDTRKRMVDSMAAIGQVYKAHGDGLMQQTQELARRSSLPINPENVTTMAGFANREQDLSFPGGGSTGREGSGNGPPVPPVEHDDGTQTIVDSTGRTRTVRKIE